MRVHGVVFIGNPDEDVESTITSVGRARRLGRLPIIEPLNAARLAEAFRANFDLRDFGGSMVEQSRSPVWHPFTQHALQPVMTKIAAAKGAWLTAADGTRIFDAISSWWVITHGHNYPPIVEAIRKQAGVLDQVIFAGFTHEPAEEVARRLLAIAPAGLAHVFFSDSGSTSVEVALKMALGFFRNRGEPRSRIVALEHGYHGDTIGCMSVGARGVFNAPYEPLLFEVERIPFPSANAEQANHRRVRGRLPPRAPAALILEPLILGAGGMLIYGASVLRELKRICEAFGVLFIADEVMTGFGRTGTLFACEQADISPDIMCLAKGLTGGASRSRSRFASLRFSRRITHPTAPACSTLELLHREPHRLRCRRRQPRCVGG